MPSSPCWTANLPYGGSEADHPDVWNFMYLRRLRSYVRQIFALRARDAPYRYLVRRWDAISDIDLAMKILDTQFFRGELEPLPLPIESFERILVLAPHQDDEAIGAGGTLLTASAGGADLDILYVTDGALQTPPYAKTAEESIRCRRQEAIEVCDRLGAAMHELGISNIAPIPSINDLDRLSQLIATLKPQVIMLPWLLDLPAKHRMVNHMLWLANRRSDLGAIEIWGYQVHNALFPNGYVDITAVAEQKRSLIRCYRSENEYSQCYDHLAMGMSAWNARFLPQDPRPRFVEIFFTLPATEFLRLVERFYFDDFWTTYRGNHDVISGIKPVHDLVMAARP